MKTTSKSTKRLRRSDAGLKFFRLDKLVAANRPIETVFDGVILRRTVTGLVGPAGSTKTSILLHMCVAVAARVPLLGLKALHGPAFMFLAESNVHAIRRVKAIAADKKISFKGRPLYLSNKGAQLFDERVARRVSNMIAAKCKRWKRPPMFIAIDPLSKAIMPGDENSAADMGKFLDNIDRYFTRRFGCAVVIAHHSGHMSGRGRGSSAFRPALDTEIIVSRKDDLITLRCTKQKDLAEFAPISLRLRVVPLSAKRADGTMDTSIVLDPVNTPASGKQYAAMATLSQMAEQHPKGVPTVEWRRRLIGEKLIAGKKAFSKLSCRLRDKKLITNRGKLTIVCEG